MGGELRLGGGGGAWRRWGGAAGERLQVGVCGCGELRGCSAVELKRE